MLRSHLDDAFASDLPPLAAAILCGFERTKDYKYAPYESRHITRFVAPAQVSWVHTLPRLAIKFPHYNVYSGILHTQLYVFYQDGSLREILFTVDAEF